MAMTECPECGNMISDKAKQCPKCGYEPKRNPATPPPLPPDLNPNGGGKKRAGLIWLLVALAVVIIAGIGYYIYSRNEAAQKEKEAAELAAKQRADSLANEARLDSLRMDSLAREEFIASLVKPGDLLRVTTTTYSGESVPDIIFRRDAEDRLREAGYDVTDIVHDRRECEGGEMIPYTVTTYEKSWGEGARLWSKVILDSGCCGGYTIEFCDEEQYNRFLEECKKLGYSQKRNENGSELLMIGKTVNGEDVSWYIHENYHAVIELLKNKVVINFGCI